MMQLDDKIYVAGYHGMVGAALVRQLKQLGYKNVLGHSSKELDLQQQKPVENFFESCKPDYVFLAAAKVGGIIANNTYPAEFIYSNLQIQLNVIHAAYRYKVRRLLFLGSSCIYPKFAPQPIKEEFLLEGKLEPTNEAYAVAKIAGLKMCDAYNKQYGTQFMSVMPTNLYGPGDNYDAVNSHVVPGLIRRFHEAKIRGDDNVTIWGTGTPKREFLYVDDLAQACIFLMNENPKNDLINVGSGQEVTIADLAAQISKVVGFKGQINFDRTKPDGTPRKFLDCSKIFALGWQPKRGLLEGLNLAYQDFLTGQVRL